MKVSDKPEYNSLNFTKNQSTIEVLIHFFAIVHDSERNCHGHEQYLVQYRFQDELNVAYRGIQSTAAMFFSSQLGPVDIKLDLDWKNEPVHSCVTTEYAPYAYKEKWHNNDQNDYSR